MAVNECSIGPLYLAKTETTKFFCPFHRVGVVEMVKPWRSGHAIVIPCFPHQAFVLGLWTRTIDEDIEVDFADEQWLSPRHLDSVPIEDISKWGVDAAQDEEFRES